MPRLPSVPPVLHRALLDLFGRLPRGVRRRLVRWGSPSYTVGAVCVVERADGRVLLVRQRYRNHWGLPGGLLSRREPPADAARREVEEEVGLRVEPLGEPVVVVEPGPQRVDVVFRARPVDDADADAAAPRSPEVVEVRWFPRLELPQLQHETVQALMALARDDTEPFSARGDREERHG